jgi:hypothetical protein
MLHGINMDNEWQKRTLAGDTFMYEMLWICIHGHKWIGLAYQFRSAKSSSFLAKAAHKEKELGLAENHVMIVNGLEVSFRICFFLTFNDFQWLSMIIKSTGNHVPDYNFSRQAPRTLALATRALDSQNPAIERALEHRPVGARHEFSSSLTISAHLCPTTICDPACKAKSNSSSAPSDKSWRVKLNVYFTWWNWM